MYIPYYGTEIYAIKILCFSSFCVIITLNIFKSLQLFSRSCTGANFRFIPFGVHRRFHHPLVSEGVKHLHVSQVFVTIMAANSINLA